MKKDIGEKQLNDELKETIEMLKEMDVNFSVHIHRQQHEHRHKHESSKKRKEQIAVADQTTEQKITDKLKEGPVKTLGHLYRLIGGNKNRFHDTCRAMRRRGALVQKHGLWVVRKTGEK